MAATAAYLLTSAEVAMKQTWLSHTLAHIPPVKPGTLLLDH
jgi:hypothetical protein